MNRFYFAVLCGALLLGCTATWAAEPVPPPTSFLTGADVRFDATAGWRGGEWIGNSLSGLALVHANWDPPPDAKSGGSWHGYASLLGLDGRGPTGRYLGDYLSASNIEGHNSARVYSWWLERDQGAWSLRTGALLADEEFNGTDSGGHLLNSSFGWPAFISADTVNTGPAFYAAALGVRVRWTASNATSVQAGVYDGDTFDSPDRDATINRNGLHYRLGGSQGWFIIAEGTWRPAADSPLKLRLGAWFHTGEFSDVYRDLQGQPMALSGKAPRRYSGNHGEYAVLERVLAGKSGEPGCIDSHIRCGAAPANRNSLAWVIDAGVSCRGAAPARPNDSLTIGFTHAAFSSDYSDNQKQLNHSQPAPDYEEVGELSYEWKTKAGLILQPDLQWIIHTGGSSQLGSSLVLTLRCSENF